MHISLHGRQRGIGHIGAILVIVVILAAAGVGWWVWQKNKNDSKSTTKTQQDAIKNAKCEYDDQDLCKFFASWKATDHFTAEATSETNGQQAKTTIQTEGSDKSHITTTSGPTNYEAITIGNTVYTKSGDTWYRQTIPEGNMDEYKGNIDVDFVEPSPNDDVSVTYKKIGEEKCGELNCFKYEVVDPNLENTTQYIWFDNKDYLLRRTQAASPDGTYDVAFSYDHVSIKEPSPVQDLAPNQYIMPGQSEPITLPSTGSF